MSEYIIQYKTPAKDSGEAIPIGNGRIGCMVYGNTSNELIKINLDSFWSGRKIDRLNPEACKGLDEVRKLIESGDISDAEKLAAEKMHSAVPESRRFMPFLELHIDNILGGKPKQYLRCLNTETGVSSADFYINDNHYERTYFCTGDDGLITGIFCDHDKNISFDVYLVGREEFCTEHHAIKKDMIIYSGGIGGKNGINYTACLAVKVSGGEVKTIGNKICVRNADSAMIIFNARTDTDTESFSEHRDFVIDAINDTLLMKYDDILNSYISWYGSIFNRVNLSLANNTPENLENFSTDERIRRLKGDELDSRECNRLIYDNKLIELYFNFSRYLMITSGTFNYPLNICGIWNDNYNSSLRYILSGNFQMCYWSADVCNMSECLYPFFELINTICESGSETAKKMYGVKGSVCHTAADLWGDSAPHGTEPDSIWCMGLAWLAIHIFEHYEYTYDRNFLERRYDIMKKAAEFFVNHLVKDDTGHLTVTPSVSPTNAYITENGLKANLCSSASVDSQILRVLFNDIIKASDILNQDCKFAENLKKILPELHEIEIGKYGQIKQWNNDYNEADSENGILYQLFALHPADLITPERTPKLADASRTTLVRRLIHGGLDKGWACAWTANMWARLRDGHMVYENIKNLLTNSTSANLVNNYPYFSIDANMGAVSAIAESLLQSTNGEIILLPALPDEWNTGSVTGLKAKGGFEISMTWENGKLKSAEIFSDFGGECRIRFTGNIAVSIICEDEDVSTKIENGVVIFDTTKKTSYTVRC